MDETVLTLAQWLSPAFPTGGFAYSHGLEWAIVDGEVTTAADVEAWVGDVLRAGAGASDAALVVAAMAPDARLDELDLLARALCVAEERWIETSEQGAAFSRAANVATGADDPPAALPVAVGRAAGRLGAEPELVAALYLQAFATAIVLAAVRFVPLGGDEGQRIVAALRPVCLAAARTAARTPPDRIGTSALGAEFAAMRHAGLDARTFRT